MSTLRSWGVWTARWILALAGLAPLAGQPPAAPLTLDECLRLAESVPSAISIARRDREIADHLRVQARAGFLPQSLVQIHQNYNSPSMLDRSEFSFIALNGIKEFVTLVGIVQEIDTSGRLRAEMGIARAAQAAASASIGIARRDLRRLVATSYYRLLLARHVEDVLRSVLAESESFETRTKLLFEGGEAARADLVKASAQVASLRQALSVAELASEMANQDLASYWTTETDTRLSIEDVFEKPLVPPEEPPPGGNAAPPYLARLEFRLFDAQFQGFQQEARRAKAAMLPQMTLAYQFGQDATSLDWRKRGYATFAALNIPVFDWFRSLSAARQFRARAAQVSDNRVIAERTFSRDYQSALSRVRRYYGQVELSRAQVDLADDNLRLSRLRYEGGEGPALDVVVSQNQLAQARSNYYATISNYLAAQWDLEVAAGR